jgi:TetR/AcrR family transcriptional regulator
VESRRRILEAAMPHFARGGLAGARVEEIVADTGLSHRMLYHYFDSKEGLYGATLELAYEQIREAERALNLGGMEPLAALRRLVEFTFDYYVDNPHFMALLHQENLQGGSVVTKSERIRALQSPLIESLTGLIERGTAAGVLRRPIDPIHLYIDIAGLAWFALSNRHTLSAIFDRPMSSPEFLEERRRHVADFVIAGVSADCPKE